MSIQGNMNQILSLNTLLLTQMSGFKAAAEKRANLKANKQAIKAVEDRVKVGTEANAEAIHSGGAVGRTGPALQERADLFKERYKLDPKMETWEDYQRARLEASERLELEQLASEGKIAAEDLTAESSLTKAEVGQKYIDTLKMKRQKEDGFDSMIEADIKHYSGMSEPSEIKSVEDMGQIDDPNTYQPLPAYIAHEDATKALEDAQNSRRLGRISVDWRPYM